MIDGHDFRNAMQHLAAGVCIVTGCHDGGLSGFTATSVMSLSADPPTIVVGVSRETAAHDIILRSRVFVLNLLKKEHVGLANLFAGRGELKGAGRFAKGSWSSGIQGCPILTDGLASFECRLSQSIGYDTHILLLGLVMRVAVSEDGSSPLIYWTRTFNDIGDLALAPGSLHATQTAGNC